MLKRGGPEFSRCPHPAGSIIMVSGAMGRASDWDRQLPLAERYNLLRFPISGNAERDSGELLAACRERGIVSPHLLGHSLGSLACLEFCDATSRPDALALRPKTLALVCPVSMPRGSPADRVLLFFEEEGAARDLPAAVRSSLSSDATIMLVRSHYPFRDSPVRFNVVYSEFIGEGNRMRPDDNAKNGGAKGKF
ncbi:MAG: alpha/beta hydrolase [Candidatus Micrarchaeota archaeon]